MKRFRSFALLPAGVLAALVAMLPTLAPTGLVQHAAAQGQPVTLPFATLSQGTAWYVYGATMAELLRKTLPPGSNIDVKPFSGGVGNPKLVAKNETPIALSFSVTNRWAYEGRESYDAKLENLRGLVGGLDTYYLIAVAAKKLDVASLQQVKERKLAAKLYTLPVGSLGEFGARQLLREYGLSYNDIKGFGGSVTHVNYNVIVDAFKDGRADLLIAVITPKHPSITEIATFVDVRFLGLEPDRIKGLAALGYTSATMAADTFKNQTQPVPTVGFPTVLIANKELAEPVAYTITKTLIENKDALVRGHAGLGEFDPKTSWQPAAVGIPLHAGAERAYREKGWMR
jgi:TRAP transporter TAXI family solute receptor